MISVILAFFTAIPGIGGIVTSLTSAFFNAKVSLAQAKIGGDVAAARALVSNSEVEAHESNERLKTIAGSRGLMFLVIGFALPFMVYVWKVVVVDIVIGPGSFTLFWLWTFTWVGETDAIKGNVADWGNTIIIAIFGSCTTLALGHMWFTRPGAKD